MGIENIASSSDAAELLRFPNLNCQELAQVEELSKNGIFIGRAHLLPYFLNFETLMNPHIFVCGITGSGKTFLMKNLIIKMSCIMDCSIIFIDFTGEYGEISGLLGCSEANEFENSFVTAEKNLVHINLKNKENEKTKVEAAAKTLEIIIETMRKRISPRRRTFIVLDEAWKLLSENNSLQTLLREGRKYGHGLIFSSQILEDIDLGMLSNVATLFIFRLQDKQGLNKIANNYNLKNGQIKIIQNLEVGSCAIIQTNAFNSRGFFVIKRVAGIRLEEFTRILTSDHMEFEIQKEKFENLISSICGKETCEKILRQNEKNKSIELAELIEFLLKSGVDKSLVLMAIRKMGIQDIEIANAFALSTIRMVTSNEIPK